MAFDSPRVVNTHFQLTKKIVFAKNNLELIGMNKVMEGLCHSLANTTIVKYIKLKKYVYLHTINNILTLSPEIVGILFRVQVAVLSGHPCAVVSAEEPHVY